MESVVTLEDFIERTKDIKNILIGNGFGLSHPILKSAFKWNVREALSLFSDDLPIQSNDSPESDLGIIRRKLLNQILRYYIIKLSESLGVPDIENLSDIYTKYTTHNSSLNCKRFLSGRDRIFTLNYDPVLYFEILKYTKEKIFFDGFIHSGDPRIDECLKLFHDDSMPEDGFLKQEYISCKLKNHTPGKVCAKIFFLHGSWFIQSNEDNELKKISFSSTVNFLINDLFNGACKPHLILEDRWWVKKALLDESCGIYFKYCFDELKNMMGDLLIFGCSFEKDDHILEQLRDSSVENIYITFLNDIDHDAIQKKLAEKCVTKKKIQFLKIGPNVIWEKP